MTRGALRRLYDGIVIERFGGGDVRLARPGGGCEGIEVDPGAAQLRLNPPVIAQDIDSLRDARLSIARGIPRGQRRGEPACCEIWNEIFADRRAHRASTAADPSRPTVRSLSVVARGHRAGIVTRPFQSPRRSRFVPFHDLGSGGKGRTSSQRDERSRGVARQLAVRQPHRYPAARQTMSRAAARDRGCCLRDPSGRPSRRAGCRDTESRRSHPSRNSEQPLRIASKPLYDIRRTPAIARRLPFAFFDRPQAVPQRGEACPRRETCREACRRRRGGVEDRRIRVDPGVARGKQRQNESPRSWQSPFRGADRDRVRPAAGIEGRP